MREAFTRFSHIYESLEIAAENIDAFDGIADLLCSVLRPLDRSD